MRVARVKLPQNWSCGEVLYFSQMVSEGPPLRMTYSRGGPAWTGGGGTGCEGTTLFALTRVTASCACKESGRRAAQRTAAERMGKLGILMVACGGVTDGIYKRFS